MPVDPVITCYRWYEIIMLSKFPILSMEVNSLPLQSAMAYRRYESYCGC